MNAVIIYDVNISSDVNEFVEEFSKQAIFSLIDMFLKYNQLTLAKECWNMTVIQMILRLLQQIIILMKEINSVAQFVHAIIKILNSLISKKCYVFINDIRVKES